MKFCQMNFAKMKFCQIKQNFGRKKHLSKLNDICSHIVNKSIATGFLVVANLSQMKFLRKMKFSQMNFAREWIGVTNMCQMNFCWSSPNEVSPNKILAEKKQVLAKFIWQNFILQRNFIWLRLATPIHTLETFFLAKILFYFAKLHFGEVHSAKLHLAKLHLAWIGYTNLFPVFARFDTGSASGIAFIKQLDRHTYRHTNAQFYLDTLLVSWDYFKNRIIRIPIFCVYLLSHNYYITQEGSLKKTDDL